MVERRTRTARFSGALLLAGLAATACSSGSGSGSIGLSLRTSSAGTSSPARPGLTPAQLRSRIVTPAEADLSGTPPDVHAERTNGFATASESLDVPGGLLVLVLLEATPTDTTARGVIKVNSYVYEGGTVGKYTSTPVHIGDTSAEYAGTDKFTKATSVEVLFAKGPVYGSVEISRADDNPGALPASARATVERIARAQAAKLG